MPNDQTQPTPQYGSNPFYNPTQPQTGSGPVGSVRPPVLQPSDHAETERQQHTSSQAAVDLIRQKLHAIYQEEPDAKQELAEAEAPLAPGQQHSRHQQFMQSLHASGKPMSQIQAEWHQYYQQLPDDEKREVWQEFYSQSSQTKQRTARIQPQYHYQPQPDTSTYALPSSDNAPVAASAPATQPLQSAQPTVTVGAPNNPLYNSPLSAPMGQAEADSHPDLAKAGDTPLSLPDAEHPTSVAATGTRPVGAIRDHIRKTARSRGAVRAKHHLQSLLFGLGFGGLVVVFVLFSFFNEVVIAPFVQPSRKVSATPLIVDSNGTAASDKNEVIIPKINVQIPLDFSAKTTDEKEFEAALDKGVSHYPTTALPGQQGNASFFGHSSNNIFNPGKYKFAFVLLNELVPGDTFYLNYNGVSYAYQVYDKKIVEANQVDILNPVANKNATAMLVTCDPPGTSLRRLAVWGEQVSPNPNDNGAATPEAATTDSNTDLPGNGPTLWRRIINSISGD